MSPTDLHSTLVAKVTEYLKIAEAATPGGWRVFGSWLAVAVDRCTCAGFEPYGHESHCGYEPMTDQLHEPDAEHIAAHDPSWAIRSHRQALETLGRHAPDFAAVECRWCYAGDDHETGAPGFLPYPCPEVAGVRAIYLPEE